MKYVPHPYQLRAEKHLERNPSAALFLDMGLGKTVVSATVISKLIDRLDIQAALIVAPLRVVELTWPSEIRKWNHTKHLRVRRINGSLIAKERRKKGSLETFFTKPIQDALSELKKHADIYLIHYELLSDLTEWMSGQKEIPFDLIVFDESSMMKNPTSQRFRTLKPHLHRFGRRWILTASPASENYENLWSQIYILDEGKRLGKFITHFRDRHFTFNPYNRFERKLKEGHDKIIEAKIADLCLCLKAEDYLDMPKLITNRVDVSLPDSLMKKYKELEQEMFTALSQKVEVEALNAASLSMKCRQFTSGAIYRARKIDEDGTPIGPQEWDFIHDAKMDALEEIREETSSPLIVVYQFRHELERLLKRYPGTPWLGSGSKNAKKTEELWNAGRLPLLLCHPRSVGHGVNLQYGGHTIVWFSLTFSLESYEQMVGRLYRQGQKHPVIVHYLMVPKTIDEPVLAAVKRKAKGQASLLEALKAYRDAA